MSSSRLRRAASADRVTSERSRRDYDLGSACGKSCDLVGFPYCCTKHYNAYRRWPYYLEPQQDYPYYHKYSHHLRYWPDWPYYSTYSDYGYQRRPWLYYEDDYYRDYLRGYTEGMRKYSSQRKLSGSGGADLAASAVTYTDSYPPYWWYSRPYYYRRYL